MRRERRPALDLYAGLLCGGVWLHLNYSEASLSTWQVVSATFSRLLQAVWEGELNG